MEQRRSRCRTCGHEWEWGGYKLALTESAKAHNRKHSACPRCSSGDSLILGGPISDELTVEDLQRNTGDVAELPATMAQRSPTWGTLAIQTGFLVRVGARWVRWNTREMRHEATTDVRSEGALDAYVFSSRERAMRVAWGMLADKIDDDIALVPVSAELRLTGPELTATWRAADD